MNNSIALFTNWVPCDAGDDWEWYKVRDVVITAARLESFLRACAGSNDEFPIALVAKDEAATEVLIGLLQNLGQQLETIDARMTFDPAMLV